MAHHSVSDRSKPASSTTGETGTQPCDLPAPSAEAKFDCNLTELATRFVTQSGGGLSPGLSADLALEIVLNEIVEQACLATRATGAAIVLTDDGEMVCRASSGDTAPALGLRFDIASGLSRLCIETGHVQRCDDAQSDLRTDMEACRRLGVRSVMVLPLVRDAEVVGLFEVFSSRPSAFGVRDEHTLDALSRRVLKNLELAAEPLPEPVNVSRTFNRIADDSQVDSESSHELDPSFASSLLPSFMEATRETPSGYGFDFVTGALGAAVLAGAVLLAVLIGQRLGGRNVGRNSMTGQGQVARSVSEEARSAQRRDEQPHGALITARRAGVGTNDLSTASASTAGPSRRDTARQLGASASLLSKDSSLADGGLRVYENGKEIFRMSPSVGQGELSPNPGDVEVRQASGIEPARVLELSPAAAEGSLLRRVEPEYPEEARQEQIQGLVVLDVHINRDGEVQNVNVVSGQPLLADAAIAAVKLWRFSPRRVNGHAREMQTTVTLNFRLPTQPKM